MANCRISPARPGIQYLTQINQQATAAFDWRVDSDVASFKENKDQKVWSTARVYVQDQFNEFVYCYIAPFLNEWMDEIIVGSKFTFGDFIARATFFYCLLTVRAQKKRAPQNSIKPDSNVNQ
jgi:hypothetical protein